MSRLAAQNAARQGRHRHATHQPTSSSTRSTFSSLNSSVSVAAAWHTAALLPVYRATGRTVDCSVDIGSAAAAVARERPHLCVLLLAAAGAAWTTV